MVSWESHVATAQEGGARLDLFLLGRYPHLSRSQASRLIQEGMVLLEGRPAKPSKVVRPGQTVAIAFPPPRPALPQPEDIPLPILHEDSDIIVVNKPPGMTAHPGAGQPSGTLVNALLHHTHDLSGIGGVLRPGIVHRLDRDTSGVMVVAKNDLAHQGLSAQFASRKVTKVYLAIVLGHPQPPQGVLDTPFGRHPTERKKFSCRTPSDRRAVTLYSVIQPLGPASLVEARPRTGRTHQIRVHLTFLGHPIVGDKLYGRRRLAGAHPPLPDMARQALHASRLELTHPRHGQIMSFFAPLPPDMERLIRELLGQGDDHADI